MKTKEIKINCPDGFEIDKENSTFECIKFKPIKKELPKTWEEYCKTNTIKIGESWITEGSLIRSTGVGVAGDNRFCSEDRNFLPNKEYAEAMLALCQLIQLRDCYNDGWVPDWTKSDPKYCVTLTNNNDIVWVVNVNISRVLSFKTTDLCNEFIDNFKDLIEIAKPLL